MGLNDPLYFFCLYNTVLTPVVLIASSITGEIHGVHRTVVLLDVLPLVNMVVVPAIVQTYATIRVAPHIVHPIVQTAFVGFALLIAAVQLVVVKTVIQRVTKLLVRTYVILHARLG